MPFLEKTNQILAANERTIEQLKLIGTLERQRTGVGVLLGAGRSNRQGTQEIISILLGLDGKLDQLRRSVLDAGAVPDLSASSTGS